MFQEYEVETILWALQTHKTRPNLLVSFFPPHVIRISQRTFSHQWDLISQKYPSKLSLTSVLRNPLAQRLEAKLLMNPKQAPEEMGSFYPQARPCRTWWSWPRKDSPLLNGTLTLAMVRQQSSQVSSGSFVSQSSLSFELTALWAQFLELLVLHRARLRLGWVREPWQHPQVVGVYPRGDVVGAHVPAIRFR